ncbi:MAG TPA: hypothetical protein VH592_14485 [Gemmataceae bacterium]|jgi:hypothetical protein
MRVSTWLRLASLCLIAGSLSASPLAARSPVPEPKKPLYHEEFTGYGATELAAREDALRLACDWMQQNLGLGWCPKSDYLLDQKMVQFRDPEDKQFEPPLNNMKVVKMQLDITDNQYFDIHKQAQHQRMQERQKTSLLVLFGLVSLLGVVGGYLRLEEATKGYFTRLLRIAAIGVLVLILAGLCVVG